MQKILVTGSAGFIGFHLCKSLLDDGFSVLGIDNINAYYDQKLKLDRLNILKKNNNFMFKKIDLSDKRSLNQSFKEFIPDKVVNLAAQAGVRYSLSNPEAYIESNINGFLNILELCRSYNVKGLIYASSSSVYGSNQNLPFSVKDRVNNPLSLYAATKLANELMAHSYTHLYGIPTTGLRYFTVYGPWGRPDMAMFIFAQNISKRQPIHLFNNGNMERDFTFIDDIINGTKSAIKKNYKCEIFNLGNNRSENLMDVVKLLEECIGKSAKIDFKPMQPGDVVKTFADISKSKELLGYEPKTNIDKGIKLFINWYKHYTNFL